MPNGLGSDHPVAASDRQASRLQARQPADCPLTPTFTMAQLIFVYGSLKRGFELHHFMSGSSFEGQAMTQPNYRLVDCGSYPGLIPSTDGICIHGEVYSVSDRRLQTLDEVEGVDEGLYERATVRLKPPFEHAAVQAYFYRQPTGHLNDCGPRWPTAPD